MPLGMQYSCLLTTLLIITLLVLLPRDGSLLGKSKLIVVLNIVCLILVLSVRTTAKGAGAFLGIQESCLLIIISLLIIIVIPRGTGAFGELKIVVANYTT